VANASLVFVIPWTRPEVCLPGARPQGPRPDVGYWCEAHTPKDAIFIVDPRSRHFRIYSKRSILGNSKDGARAAFSKRFAREWIVRMSELWDYENMTEARCIALAERYGASHIVTRTDHQLRFPLLYQNERFSVYRIVNGTTGAENVFYYNRGVDRMNRGEYDKAITHFNTAIRLAPDNVMAYNNRGFAYQNNGQLDKALTDYSEAMRLDPHALVARRNRGLLHAAMGEYEMAVADFTRLIQMDPNSILGYGCRAGAYYGLGQHDKAVADLTEAIRLDPTRPEHFSARAAVYRALGDQANAAGDERKARELSR
jgi:tetratricopeptide (TPR) repeat protein